MNDEPGNSDLLSNLMEIAKGGSNRSRQSDLDRWARELGLQLNGSWENQYFQLLSVQLAIEKAASHPNQHLPDPIAPPETEELPTATFELAPLVHEALSYHDWTYLEEVLRILRSQQKMIHPSLLPAILDQCKTKTELHYLLTQTLGKRSHWLSRLKDEWSWWVELTFDTIEKVSADNRLNWALFHYRMEETELANEVVRLTLNDRKLFLSHAAKFRNRNNESIARSFVDARSPFERSLALQILLQSSSPERVTTMEALQQFCRETIQHKKKGLIWNISDQNEFQAFPVSLQDLNYGEEKLQHPLQNIIQLFSPEEVFEHLKLKDDEIICHLMIDARLQNLYQIIVNCAANLYSPSTWGEKILAQWIHKYPEGNTTEVLLTKLLAEISYDTTQKIMIDLLNTNDSYFIEKLTLIISGIKHYIRKDLSIKIVEKIFHLLTLRLTRTDSENLLIAIPHLQYQLDPGVNNSVLSQWVEIDFRHQKLGEALWEFRNMIRLRSELLSVLVP
ncbi:MAG: hypothetical protein IPL46_12130 [Saprospiraceae bacterium]|nr:hypothetical protein [Saprospiraceae bacterium]